MQIREEENTTLRKRSVLVLTFTAALAVAFLLKSGMAQINTVKQIVPGVWFREGDLMREGHCNNAIIEMQDYLIVVDANFPSGARLVIEDARKLSPKPIRYVFDTHHHGDHAYANAVWTKMGAITLAYAGVAEEMKRYEPKRWQETAKSRADVRELNLPTAEPPKETFTKSPHIIQDATRTVQFHFFGWAHTRGDGFVYLPKEKLLCTGDAATNGPFNYTADANIANWPKVMDAALKLDIEHVLPGHGPHGGKDILENQGRFMKELRSAVEQAVKDGKKLGDIVTMKGDRPVATAIKLPDSVKRHVGGSLPAQVRDAYNEITSGKPSGDLPH
jgi:glyoxylase-like metal-dependent hydrolase (beta-lactamase superfamily II)